MAMFLIAHLIKETPEVVLYWVRNGSDITQGETLVIPIDNPNASYTVGYETIRPWSGSIIGKILHEHTDPDHWPQTVMLQS